MQIIGYIIAAIALVFSIQAIPQFGHHGFMGRGPMMGPMRGGFGARGNMGMRGGPAVVSKTVVTKTVVRG